MIFIFHSGSKYKYDHVAHHGGKTDCMYRNLVGKTVENKATRKNNCICILLRFFHFDFFIYIILNGCILIALGKNTDC